MGSVLTQKHNATLTLPLSEGQTVELELPILPSTLGPNVIDIQAIATKADIFTFDPGFMVTAACESKITYIDGNKGILLHRGYPIEQLAQSADYLEVAYLLLHGELPSRAQLEQFTQNINVECHVSQDLNQLLATLPTSSHPMALLCALVSALMAYTHGRYNHTNANDRIAAATALIAKIPLLAAMAYRHTQNLPPLQPNPDLNVIENFLYMLFGKPDETYSKNPTLVRALNRIFILHADHEQNASTSTVRLAGSTGTDPFAAISAGIAALWGPAHGGANEAALNMLIEIGSPDHIEHYLAKAKDPQDPFRLMGFGHRVYKNYDPRAKLMQESCHEVLETTNSHQDPLFKLAVQLERIALEDPYFVSRKLYPNVDFYSGITLSAMGIPPSLFTAIFASARTSGWVAHWHEMWSDPRTKIGRPRQLYTGEKKRDYPRTASA